MMQRRRSGYIVMFALIILAGVVAVTQQLMRNVFVGRGYAHIVHDREQAKVLALSGINLAIGQLLEHDYYTAVAQNSSVKPSSNQVDPALQETRLFLKKILPTLNCWQRFSLTESIDGVDAQLGICICSEHGKLNINDMFDFNKKNIRPEYEPLLKALVIKDVLAPGVLYDRFKDFFIQKNRKLRDVSELFTIDELKTLDIFYYPPEPMAAMGVLPDQRPFALLDLFTVWGDNGLDPVFFSDALRAMMQCRRPEAGDSVALQSEFATFAQEFDPQWYAQPDYLLDKLMPLYKQKNAVADTIKKLFSKRFGPMVYSVLSYGKVGNVEQRLLAIIKYVPASKAQNNKKESQSDTSQSIPFRVVRLYWL